MTDQETPKQKEKRLLMRDLCRCTICGGCRYNRYNYPVPKIGNDAPVPEDSSCYFIVDIRKGRCRYYFKEIK